MQFLIYAALGAVSLVSGIATGRLGYQMASNPDAGDKRTMSERELRIAKWLVPVVLFVLGALFPLFFFVARGARDRAMRSSN